MGAERVVVLVYRLPRQLGRSGNLPKRRSPEKTHFHIVFEFEFGIGLELEFNKFSLTLPSAGDQGGLFVGFFYNSRTSRGRPPFNKRSPK
jgi:hypothetical protein